MNLEIALCCLETRITYLSVKLYNMMAHSTLIIIIMIMEQMILGGVHSNNESKYFFSLYLIGFGTNKYREVNYKF